ncbi:hypothetical protein [Luteipulveratus flavus]|uniref:Lipid/polyisoprenoid-binding YceI-like domain-containing protein n=1 Tax=Luteipulveratus flavus TaxID=3031728 RepID=A0ABT6C7T8_9MICO|nr:hypothetical protein [Luteipulveratus sp. YIM 133296]MDF8263351.1 hypothetical protein [Luteipulveratus sp. YIM 133296]
MPSRTLISLAAVATSGATLMATAPGAQAEVWELHHTATASTYIKSMNQTVTTTGTQTANFDLEKRTLSANLSLKDATSPVKVIGLPLAKATIRIEPLGPATGTVDFSNNISVTQRLNIRIVKIQPLGLPVNLVGNSCKTSSPVTMKLSGKQGGLFDPFTLKGSFDIPKFADCGLATPIVSKMVSGSGNTVKIDYVAAP